ALSGIKTERARGRKHRGGQEWVMSTIASNLGVDGLALAELSDEQYAELFDRIVRKNMGITAEEFLVRWDAGRYRGVDWDDVSGLDVLPHDADSGVVEPVRCGRLDLDPHLE